MKRKSVIVWAVVSASVLCGAAGCTLEQLERADRAVADANQAAAGVAAIAEGPAAPLIPPEIRALLELIGLGGAAAAIGWQKIRQTRILERNTDLTVTAKAIVDAIQATDAAAAAPVKAKIEAVMTDRRIYDKADAIVDELKAQKGAPIA